MSSYKDDFNIKFLPLIMNLVNIESLMDRQTFILIAEEMTN